MCARLLEISVPLPTRQVRIRQPKMPSRSLPLLKWNSAGPNFNLIHLEKNNALGLIVYFALAREVSFPPPPPPSASFLVV